MSFSMTMGQFMDGSKDVTRRLGWASLGVGDRLTGVEKCMGLKAGERQVVLGEIEIVSVRSERLDAITDDDVRREGFPGETAVWFVALFCAAMRCGPETMVRRIEYRYLEPTP